MTHILIVESNAPDMVARGVSAANPFQSVLSALSGGTDLTVTAPYETPFGRDSLAGVDAVVFTGSGVEWSVDDPRAGPLARAMQTVFDRGLPVWGSCNGMQLGAVLLGGAVGTSPNGREDGLARDIRLTQAGRDHPMMSGRADGFAVPCVHRDEVTALPDGAVLLATNAHSPVQAFAYQRDGVDFWAAQYHPELTAANVADSVRRIGGADAYADDLAAAGQDAQAARRIGTSPTELALATRATELRNWLAHVAA